MLQMSGEDERIAAVLHDVVEDAPVPLSAIRIGYGDDVADAVDALTRRDGEDYDSFIERCGANEIARVVKLADLDDNSDLSRLKTITATDLRRVEKYGRAFNRLKAIATEARRAATGNTDAVEDEGAGPKDIAQKAAE
jgi:hypothetical protein